MVNFILIYHHADEHAAWKHQKTKQNLFGFVGASMQHARLQGEDEHAARKHPEKRKAPRRFLDVSMLHAHLGCMLILMVT